MSIIDTIYNFISSWLGGSTLLATTDIHMIAVLMTAIILVWVLYLAIMPIKALLNSIFRG